MSNPKLAAVHDLKRLSVQLRGILSIADDLERIGSLEQAEAEARSRLDKLRAETEGHKTTAASAIAAGAAAQTQAETVIEDARRQAKQIVEEAHAEAHRLLAADRRTADAALAESRTKRDKTEKAIEAAEAALEDLGKRIAVRTAQLEDLNKKLEGVRAGLAALA